MACLLVYLWGRARNILATPCRYLFSATGPMEKAFRRLELDSQTAITIFQTALRMGWSFKINFICTQSQVINEIAPGYNTQTKVSSHFEDQSQFIIS
jgi:hypothetical protein